MKKHKHWDEVIKRSQEPRPLSEQERQRAERNLRSREEWERANPQVNPRPSNQEEDNEWFVNVIVQEHNE